MGSGICVRDERSGGLKSSAVFRLSFSSTGGLFQCKSSTCSSASLQPVPVLEKDTAELFKPPGRSSLTTASQMPLPISDMLLKLNVTLKLDLQRSPSRTDFREILHAVLCCFNDRTEALLTCFHDLTVAHFKEEMILEIALVI
ncbi:hypothetical protein L596_000502 [Steinernema carpocapsae]|uniref:Uncharacterized protein n=1 Tax=Steinernema carpocapsae TaxID=34508 RepID=A0A4U8UIL3_STECR|nr:hypothetical protein L596_000502 [Steinernema carpocapsae]